MHFLTLQRERIALFKRVTRANTLVASLLVKGAERALLLLLYIFKRAMRMIHACLSLPKE